MKKITELANPLAKSEQKQVRGGITPAMARCEPGAWKMKPSLCFSSYYYNCLQWCSIGYCNVGANCELL
jgi:hypothetical protein